jgi:hypothetical protein
LSVMRIIPGKSRCFLSCHVNGRTFDHKLAGANTLITSRSQSLQSRAAGSQSLQYCVNSRCVPEW